MKIYKITTKEGNNYLTADIRNANWCKEHEYNVTQFEVKTQGKNFNMYAFELPF